MEGRFVWWKTNLAADAHILAADPGLVADGALTAAEVEARPGPAHGLSHAAKGDLAPGQRGSRIPDPRGNPVLNPQRSLVLALANLTVPPRAALGSLAPRAHPKSKPRANPGVVPRRSRPVRSHKADQGPVQRVGERNIPPNHPRARRHPSPLPSTPPPAPSLALDPDQPRRIDWISDNLRPV